MKEVFWEHIFPALLTLLGAALSWAIARGASYLRARAESSRWALASAQLVDVVGAVVAEAEVSLRPQFAKAMADGSLSAEEGKALKAEVMRLLKARLAPSTLAFLERQLGDAFGLALGGTIERAVAADKAARPPEP